MGKGAWLGVSRWLGGGAGRRESTAGNLLFEEGSLWPVLSAPSEVGLVQDCKGCKGSASGIIMTESGSFLSKF